MPNMQEYRGASSFYVRNHHAAFSTYCVNAAPTNRARAPLWLGAEIVAWAFVLSA